MNFYGKHCRGIVIPEYIQRRNNKPDPVSRKDKTTFNTETQNHHRHHHHHHLHNHHQPPPSPPSPPTTTTTTATHLNTKASMPPMPKPQVALAAKPSRITDRASLVRPWAMNLPDTVAVAPNKSTHIETQTLAG